MAIEHDQALVHAPYNFVPLSGHVHEVGWAEQLSHDVPFADGVCGTLVLSLTAKNHLCVGGHHDRQGAVNVTPFRRPDQRLALPGSSVKGMLRTVLEIVAFAKMQFVERNRRFAVRDMQNRKLYGDRMTNPPEPGPVFSPKPQPGWLRREEDGSWSIEPCQVSRVEQKELLALLAAGGHSAAEARLRECFTCQKMVRGRTTKWKASLKDKYQAWESAGLGRKLDFDPGPDTAHPMSNGRGKLRFSLAQRLGAGGTSGTLVVTGQPSANKRLTTRENKGKHREFVFYGGANQRLPIDKEVMDNFELNHSEQQGEQHGGEARPNEEWGYFRGEARQGKPVPVFYLTDAQGRISSFGMTQMYRLAYNYSVGHAVDAASVHHDPDPGSHGEALRGMAPKLDLAEALFGYVRGHNSGGDAAAGRVSVGLFSAESENVELVGPFSAVLNSPKPTYYPCYIDQSTRLDQNGVKLQGDNDYLTYMDASAQVRGWKRYPVRDRAENPHVNEPGKTTVTWEAVPRGTRFTGKVRVHNLRPAELGALLWVLDFGQREDRCHSLGLARPFGFGAVQLSLKSHDLRPNSGADAVDLDAARQAFVDEMEGDINDWLQSEQLVQLLAMADPAQAEGRKLSYMTIGNGPRDNQFVLAKKERYHRHVLPAYVDFNGTPDRKRFPRAPAERAWAELERQREQELRVEKAAEEKEERKKLGPRGRLEQDLASYLELSPGEQADMLVDLRNRALDQEEQGDPGAYVQAFKELFAEALAVVHRRARGEDSPAAQRLAKLERQHQDHQDKKPSRKDRKKLKPWAKKNDKLQKELQNAQNQLKNEEKDRKKWSDLLSWLDSLAEATPQ